MDIDTDGMQHTTSPFARRAEEYTYRVPTPPRILVPPPALNSDALPDFTLSSLPTDPHLPQKTHTNLVTQNALLDWSYHRRREAQMILPHLYLGPMTAAKDRTFLLTQGITLLIGLRHKHNFPSTQHSSALRTASDLQLQTHTIDLSSNQELIAIFPTINELMTTHLAQRTTCPQNSSAGKVLLFCESGNERSAGACAAYLMATHSDVDHVRAMQLVQAQRFCVNFDDAMKRLLQGYWDIVRAGRDCEVGPKDVQVGVGAGKRGKRALERDEEDETMGGAEDAGGDDGARFGGRGFAPFVDLA